MLFLKSQGKSSIFSSQKTFLDNVELCAPRLILSHGSLDTKDNVKMTLFKTYCTFLHTAHLWTNYKKASLQRCVKVLLK